MVEDSADDAALVLSELKRNGHAPVHQRVESKADFLAAVRVRSWDAVISDYVLPQFKRAGGVAPAAAAGIGHALHHGVRHLRRRRGGGDDEGRRE